MSHVHIFDTTLRDGEQSPGFSMNTSEKIRMAKQLAALGVDIIEAGFPIASKGDLEAVQAVSKEVRDVPIAALARARRDDILAADVPGLVAGCGRVERQQRLRERGQDRPPPAAAGTRGAGRVRADVPEGAGAYWRSGAHHAERALP